MFDLSNCLAIQLRECSSKRPFHLGLKLLRCTSWKDWRGLLVILGKASALQVSDLYDKEHLATGDAWKPFAFVTYNESLFVKGPWRLDYISSHYEFRCQMAFKTSRTLCEFLTEQHDGQCIWHDKDEGTDTTPWREFFGVEVGPRKDRIAFVLQQMLPTTLEQNKCKSRKTTV